MGELPGEIEEHMAVLRERVAEVVNGTPLPEVTDDISRAVDSLVDTARTLGAEHEPRQWADRVISYAELIGERIARLRKDAGWSQEQLAEAMDRVGFPWRRVTVAEVERATRRVSLEELTAMAALFAEPVVQLVLPRAGDHIGFPERRALQPDDVGELWLGHDTTPGRGDVEWQAAARVAGTHPSDSWRPAADLWRRRDRGYGGTA